MDSQTTGKKQLPKVSWIILFLVFLIEQVGNELTTQLKGLLLQSDLENSSLGIQNLLNLQ